MPGTAAIGPVIDRAVHIVVCSRGSKHSTSSTPRSSARPPRRVQRLAHHERKQRHHRDAHAPSIRRRVPIHDHPARRQIHPPQMLRHRRHPVFRSPRTTISACAGVSTKCCTTPSTDAGEIHHLAADQIGAVKVLVVALRQLAARHADLRAPQACAWSRSSTPSAWPSAGRRCARWLRCGSVRPRAPARSATAMFQQAFGRIRVRTQLDPTSDAEGAPTNPSSMSADDSPLIAPLEPYAACLRKAGQQELDAIRHVRALAQPMLDTRNVHAQFDFGAARHGIEQPDALEAGAALALAAVGHHNVIERASSCRRVESNGSSPSLIHLAMPSR
jgi:hypothetical protein